MKKIILLLILLVSSNIFADPIKDIVFFGDSLTDTGNLYRYDFKMMPKDPPYYQGRFSNGLAWSDYLGDYYHHKFKINYANYAVGGATVILRSPLKGFLPINLKDEVNDYLLRTVLKDRSNSLFIIMIGANDYNSEEQQNIHSLTDDVMKEINVNIKVLIDNGGQHFLLIDVPDLSKSPRVIKDPASATRLAAISQLHRAKMLASINVFKNQYPHLNFTFVSMYDIFNDILNDLDKYNTKYHLHLTDTTTACWPGGYTIKNNADTLDKKALNKELALDLLKVNSSGTLNTENLTHYIANSPALAEAYRVSQLQQKGVKACVNPDEHIFWDQIHPTTVLHQLFADIVEDALVTEGLFLANTSNT